MSRSLEDDARGSAPRDAKPGETAGIDASRLPITVRRVGKSFIASTFPRRQSSLAMAHTVHAVVVLRMLGGLRLQGLSARLPADEKGGAHSARKAREDASHGKASDGVMGDRHRTDRRVRARDEQGKARA